MVEEELFQNGVPCSAYEKLRWIGRNRRASRFVPVSRQSRRLRHDLHDGLGPTLVSLVQLLDTARTLVSRYPEAAAILLGEVKDQLKVAITGIRGLVYALRPPMLDGLGLVLAIDDHIARHNQQNCHLVLCMI